MPLSAAPQKSFNMRTPPLGTLQCVLSQWQSSDGEVNFSKEVCSTLADYSFVNRKKRHKVREGQQMAQSNSVFFFTVQHMQV